MNKSTRKLIAKYTKEQCLANAAYHRKEAKHKRKQLAELKAAAAAAGTPEQDPALDNTLARENVKRLKAFNALSEKAKARREMRCPRAVRRGVMYAHLNSKQATKATGDRP